MTGGWRDYRPAIWLAMLGIAVMLLFSPAYVGALFLGGAIGVAVKVNRGRRATASSPAGPKPRVDRSIKHQIGRSATGRNSVTSTDLHERTRRRDDPSRP